jgi:CBS domain-containing protein
MGTTGKISHEIQQVLQELATARDDARVRAHLLTEEARQRLKGLEGEIEALEGRLSARGEWVAEQVIAKARGLTHSVGQIIAGKQQEPTRARDVMTRDVLTCRPSDSVNRAAQLMWDANCGAVPVVEEQGKLVGLITDRDACMAAYTRGLPLSELRVADSMTTNLYTCRAEDSLRKVMDMMSTHQVRRVPVVDDDGRLIGIVALADVALLAQAPTVKSHEARVWVSGLLANISEPAEPQSGNGTPTQAADTPR